MDPEILVLMGSIFWLAVIGAHIFYMRMIFHWTRKTAENVQKANELLSWFAQQTHSGRRE